eukprot:CAMPEP_0168521358 /NCGR_PEP_ID=MMETSP0405-20121227/8614_1 /TAXON_ID=498012 /ORGANISM="Trichosphaerium sp, Strain Am-I-7 wt" /LENGTH=769 /DNA_ID=CAMNT_0008542573 /DNA_START=42 /DNA_END=2351 /DNA_ORIENTATION=-
MASQLFLQLFTLIVTSHAINLVGVDMPSFTGEGRNPQLPSSGRSGATLIYYGGAPFYNDGISQYRQAISGNPLPGSRAISNAVFGRQPEGRGMTKALDHDSDANLLSVYFGQLLDHDITLTHENPSESVPFPIPTGDTYMDPLNEGNKEHPFSRSAFLSGSGVTSPRQHANAITAWIDASFVYGSDDDTWMKLREYNPNEGFLKMGIDVPGDGSLLPFNFHNDTNSSLSMVDNFFPPQTEDEYLFAAGDLRANENVALVSLQTLFYREHNRYVQTLVDEGVVTDPDERFNMARLWVGALMQSITFGEYLPMLFGEDFAPYSGYDGTCSSDISASFSTAAFRYGHSQINGLIPRMNSDKLPHEQGSMLLRESFGYTQGVTAAGIGVILRGCAWSKMERTDGLAVADLRNFLFAHAPGAIGQDLISRNIERGRDHGLMSYVQAKLHFSGVTINDFTDITDNAEEVQILRDLYETVEDVDLFVGMLLEPITRGTVGQLIFDIITEQMTRIRKADWYWFENTQNTIFSPEEVNEIRQTKLRDIIMRNTEMSVSSFPGQAFEVTAAQIGQPQLSGDPHFTGFLSQKFDFHGIARRHFNLISDEDFQLNSLFLEAELRPKKVNKTYNGALAFQCGQDKLLIACNRAAGTREIFFNDKPIEDATDLKFCRGAKKMAIGDIHTKDNKKVSITLDRYKFNVRFSSSKHSSCHINFRSKYTWGDYPIPHGVLGNTANKKRTTPLTSNGRQGEGILQGSMMDYFVKDGLWGKDFKYNNFK